MNIFTFKMPEKFTGTVQELNFKYNYEHDEMYAEIVFGDELIEFNYKETTPHFGLYEGIHNNFKTLIKLAHNSGNYKFFDAFQEVMEKEIQQGLKFEANFENPANVQFKLFKFFKFLKTPQEFKLMFPEMYI